jgi:hypothetical protein
LEDAIWINTALMTWLGLIQGLSAVAMGMESVGMGSVFVIKGTLDMIAWSGPSVRRTAWAEGFARALDSVIAILDIKALFVNTNQIAQIIAQVLLMEDAKLMEVVNAIMATQEVLVNANV